MFALKRLLITIIHLNVILQNDLKLMPFPNFIDILLLWYRLTPLGHIVSNDLKKKITDITNNVDEYEYYFLTYPHVR